eukprot:IDg18722t1
MQPGSASCARVTQARCDGEMFLGDAALAVLRSMRLIYDIGSLCRFTRRGSCLHRLLESTTFAALAVGRVECRNLTLAHHLRIGDMIMRTRISCLIKLYCISRTRVLL